MQGQGQRCFIIVLSIDTVCPCDLDMYSQWLINSLSVSNLSFTKIHANSLSGDLENFVKCGPFDSDYTY